MTQKRADFSRENRVARARGAETRYNPPMLRLALACMALSAVVLAAASQPSQSRSVPQGAGRIAKDATVLGFKLHYIEAGSGAPVVLLHGLGGDGSRWAPNIDSLSRDFHVFALDQIGFGQSDKPLANYHTGMLSEFLVGFVKSVGLSKASLVGNSMGAGVALYTAVHYPDVVDRLVLADGGGYRATSDAPRSVSAPTAADLHRREIANSVTRDETREYFRIMFHDKSLVTDKMVEDNLILRLHSAFTISKIQESGEKGLGSLSEEEVRGVKAPTLIVWGKYDELANPAGADRLERAISGSKKILIDNSGHLPQLERSDDFNRVVREFLKGASPRASQ
jgi:2-hydroxy-6-oxonona-2,4-dienedioate hydrolase